MTTLEHARHGKGATLIVASEAAFKLRKRWDKSLTTAIAKLNEQIDETTDYAAEINAAYSVETDPVAKRGLGRAYDKVVRVIERGKEDLAAEPMLRLAIHSRNDDPMAVRYRAVFRCVLRDKRSSAYDGRRIGELTLKLATTAEPEKKAKEIAEDVLLRLSAEKQPKPTPAEIVQAVKAAEKK